MRLRAEQASWGKTTENPPFATPSRREGEDDMESDLKSREEILLQEFREGRDAAFDELVRLYYEKLYKIAYGLLASKQDAEEVVQDAFLRAYRGIASFRGESSFETWIHRITINLARNRFHWNKRRGEGVNVSISDQPVHEIDAQPRELDLPDSSLGPDRALENSELASTIGRAMRNLPLRLREPMLLRHFDEMPYETIAKKLDCKVGTVKSRLARGREIIRLFLEKLDSGATLSDMHAHSERKQQQDAIETSPSEKNARFSL